MTDPSDRVYVDLASTLTPLSPEQIEAILDPFPLCAVTFVGHYACDCDAECEGADAP